METPTNTPESRAEIADNAIAVVTEEGFDQAHPDSTLASLGFDSLSAIDLVCALEEKFDVQLPSEQVLGSASEHRTGVTVAQIISCIEEAVREAAPATVPEDVS
ncbi:MAG: acyl carrier protein [Kiritimatiellales bacterium]|nr:acyl carrier protein [Kiritimatiellales bacterium]